MSVSTENFLKSIYLLGKRKEVPVTSRMLAERLDVSPAAVTDMARKLGREGLLDYRPYQSLLLSEKGHKMALNVIRKHRLWELFLHQVFDLDLLSVHEEAEKLEHNTSDMLCERMYQYLGAPEFDPHGDPIPGPAGNMPSEKGTIPLTEAEQGRSYIVRKMSYHNIDSVEMYERYGLKPDLVFTVKRKYAFDGSIELETKEKNTFVITPQLGAFIFCREQKAIDR